MMYFDLSFYLPYVSTLLLICTCIITVSTQHYPQTQHFGTGQRFVPAPVYPDQADYTDNNQYSDYAASSQNEGLDRSWAIAAHQPQPNVKVAISRLNYTPVWVPDWPSPSVTLGQVTAVSLDTSGRVVVFHRATNTWDLNSFTLTNHYWNSNELPIAAPTIAVFNSTTGDLLEQWGENLFFMPHGLTVDSKNNVWVTDVALHQVMKFSAGEKEKPSLTLGVRFIPGNDDYHFCKPSAVAVMEGGDFFVSDGYCNSRVIKYSASGKKIQQWGRGVYKGIMQVLPQPYTFAIPHALALAEDKELLCVADRENGRVQCFNCHNGTFVSQFHSPIIGARVFSVAYSPAKGGQLYIINGPEETTRPVRGFVIDITTRKILSQFGPNNRDFANPHDIAVSKDGKEVFVVELDPFKVHKFVDKSIPDEVVKKTDKLVAEVVPSVTNKTLVTNAPPAPAKPTATVEVLPLGNGAWGGWAGVAGGVAGGLGAVLLLLLGGAALLARARRHGGIADKFDGISYDSEKFID